MRVYVANMRDSSDRWMVGVASTPERATEMLQKYYDKHATDDYRKESWFFETVDFELDEFSDLDSIACDPPAS